MDDNENDSARKKKKKKIRQAPLSKDEKVRRVRNIENQLEMKRFDQFISEMEVQPDAVEDVVAEEDQVAVTLNKLRLQVGLGPDNPAPAKPMNADRQRGNRVQTTHWSEYPLDTSVQIQKAAKETVGRNVGNIEIQRDQRCVQLNLNNFTLMFEPHILSQYFDSDFTGIISEAQLLWLRIIAVVATILISIPMPTDFMQTLIGGGWFYWMIEGSPSYKQEWQVVPRCICQIFCALVVSIFNFQKTRFLIFPMSCLFVAFMQAAAIAEGLYRPCSFAPQTLFALASLLGVVLATPWALQVAAQFTYLLMLVLFLAVEDLRPVGVCPTAVFSPEAGVIGHTFTASENDYIVYQYYQMFFAALCYLPLIYFFTRERKLRILYQFYNALVFEQYLFLLRTVLQQTEIELDRTRSNLELANQSLQKVKRKHETERKGTQGHTVSLLDIFRDMDGFLTPVIVHKHLCLLPNWHRRRIAAALITWKRYSPPPLHGVDVVKSKPVDQIISYLTEVSTGITLQQALLDLANLY